MSRDRVIVYRLLTCDTVEEKMYKRCIFKQSLINSAKNGAKSAALFTAAELRELFRYDNPESSPTCDMLRVCDDVIMMVTTRNRRHYIKKLISLRI